MTDEKGTEGQGSGAGEAEGTAVWTVWVKPSPVAIALLKCWAQAQGTFAIALERGGYDVKVKEDYATLSWTLRAYPTTAAEWKAAEEKFLRSTLEPSVIQTIRTTLKRFRLLNRADDVKDTNVSVLKHFGFDWSWTWEEGEVK